MAAPIDFYFDFSSPYSYIASEEIEAIAERHGRELNWRPLLLGVRDFARSAAHVGVPYRHPSVFPIGAVAATRAVLWLQRELPAQVGPFIHAVYRAFFVADRNVSEAPVVMSLAQELGIDPARLAAGVQEEAIKLGLRAAVEQAIERGVFGAPTIVIDGEMFWGHDRLAQVERWIATGPF
ncbi:MAG: 2-hydroxychromene-2-carboxylate isomerase [Burkholderiaceae bacterium]|nr:2-hydroxychromene-2-carboxylate isomerase [Burkholderiaceae bacterium]